MPPAFRSFDPESGLAYTEAEVVRTKIRAFWAWPRKKTIEKFKASNVNKDGPRSLRDTALRAVGTHMTGLSSESFRHVPWALAKDLWELLKLNMLDCFAVWRMLAQAYRDDTEAVALLHRSEKFSDPTSYTDTQDCLELIKRLELPSTDWITCLTLRGVTFSRSTLIDLSELKSLSVLVIWSKEERQRQDPSALSTDHRVDNKIVRAWSDAAMEANAFAKLRILALIDQAPLTELTFAYLARLPSLYKFYAGAHNSDRGAAREQERFGGAHGWTVGGWIKWHGREFEGNDWPGVLGTRSPVLEEAVKARADQCLPALRYVLLGPRYKSSAQVRSFRRHPPSKTEMPVRGKRKAPLAEANPRKVKASKIADVLNSQAFFGMLAGDTVHEA